MDYTVVVNVFIKRVDKIHVKGHPNISDNDKENLNNQRDFNDSHDDSSSDDYNNGEAYISFSDAVDKKGIEVKGDVYNV